MKFYLTVVVLASIVALFVAIYLRWTVKKLTGYRPDYFPCYWLALTSCLANLFLPFVYRIVMAPYRKLPPGIEQLFLNFAGFLICLLLYLFGIRGSQGRVLSLAQVVLIAGTQFIFFLILSLISSANFVSFP